MPVNEPVTFTDEVGKTEFTVGDTTGLTEGTYTFTLTAVDAITDSEVAFYQIDI